jgi:hypothetical protein
MKQIPYISAPTTRYIAESVKQINGGINTINQEYPTLENKLNDQESKHSSLCVRNALSVMRDNTERVVQKYNSLYEDYEMRAHISNLRDEEIVELKKKQHEGSKTGLLALAFAGLFGLGCLAGCYIKGEIEQKTTAYVVKEVKP